MRWLDRGVSTWSTAITVTVASSVERNGGYPWWSLFAVMICLGPRSTGRRTLTSYLVIASSLLLAQTVQGVIVKSTEMARALLRHPRVPLAVVPNGVDFSLFVPMPQAEARERLGLTRTGGMYCSQRIPLSRGRRSRSLTRQLSG